VIFAAIWRCIGTPPPKIKNKKVQDTETNVSTSIEEDGNISKTREIDTITRFPVPTQHIRVASFKALPRPEDYKSYPQKINRSRFDPSRVKPPVTLRQGKRRVDKPPTRTGRASTSNFNCVTKQMKKTALAKEYEPTISSATSSQKTRSPKEKNIHISEARVVKVIDERPYIYVTLPNGDKKLALYDTGAICCCVKPSVFEQLQQNSLISWEPANFNVSGIVPGATEQTNKIAYIDIQLETGYTLKNIPFIVYDCAYDIIIGNNHVKSHRWSNYWKNDNFYIKLGPVPSRKQVQAHLRHLVECDKGVSLAEIALKPQKTAMVTLNIPNLDANSYKNWKCKDLFVETLFDEGIRTETNPLFEGLEVLPSFTKIDKDREVTVTIRNKNSKSPLKIPEGIVMVKVTTVEKIVDHLSLHEYQAARLIFNQIPRVHNIECYCHRPPLEKTEICIYIEASHPYGQTSTRSYCNSH